MRWILVFSLLALIGRGASPCDELTVLEAEFDRAHEEWREAYDAARKARVPREERPADPVAAFWPRFEALHEAGEGRAVLWLVEHAKDAGLGRKERKARLATVVARTFAEHASEPWLEELCLLLVERKHDFDRTTLQGWLDAWMQRELEPPARAAGYWLTAEWIGWNPRAERERAAEIDAALHAALRTAPESSAGEKAGRALFAALHRQVDAELRPWIERSEGADVAPPDLVAWRPRFRELAEAGVELAEVWLFGTTWLDEPGADYERLCVLADEAWERWDERLELAAAELEAANPDADPLAAAGSLMPLAWLEPRGLFWPAFEAMAEDDPRADMWLIQNVGHVLGGSQAVSDRMFRRLEDLVREHGDAEWAVELADGLMNRAAHLLGVERVRDLGLRWAETTSNEEVEIRLRFNLAFALLDENEAEGLDRLGGLIERWPDHDQAQRARERIASLPGLAIGVTAPEIVGEDLDGVEFKLSDYRGKVVVLDFWGDW